MADLTPNQFAARAGISRKSCYAYLKNGKLAFNRNPLSNRITIPLSELERVKGGTGGETVPEPTPRRRSAKTATPTPPVAQEFSAATVKKTVLRAVEERHGKPLAAQVEASWNEVIDSTIDFFGKLPGNKPDMERLENIVTSIPPTTLALPAASWLMAAIQASVYAPPKTIPPPPPPAAPAAPEPEPEPPTEEEEEAVEE